MADKVSIRWPGGKVTSFASVAADHAYVVSQADKTLRQAR